jgi:exodeoxyribonuclease VII small subunit
VSTEKLSFEEAIQRLDTIVKNLEGGKAQIDEALLLFEEGVKLVKSCESQLKSIEEKTAKILNESGLENFK